MAVAEEPASESEQRSAQSHELRNELDDPLSTGGAMRLDAESGEASPVQHDYSVRRDDLGGWMPICSCGWAGRSEREEAVALFRWTRHDAQFG